jgi:hypothetical protein
MSKQFINVGDLLALQEYFNEIQNAEFNSEPSWDFIFQKVYLHACLKKRNNIADWLKIEVFPQLGAIQQIALRQIFSYGKYRLHI